jgi:hypothetical protein
VSTRRGNMRGRTKACKQRGWAICCADQHGCFALDGCTRPMDPGDCWAHLCAKLDVTGTRAECRFAAWAWPSNGAAASSRSAGRSGRTCSDAISDAGFEVPAWNYPLWPEICSPGPHVQRITRSSRSRPSLNRMASGCVYVHRTRTPTKRRQGQRGCGTSRPPLGDGSQATADQQHFCWPSTSAAKTVLSSCYGGALEAAGEPCSCRYATADMALASWPLGVLFRVLQVRRPRPRRQHRFFGNSFLPANGKRGLQGHVCATASLCCSTH